MKEKIVPQQNVPFMSTRSPCFPVNLTLAIVNLGEGCFCTLQEL